MVTYTDLNLGVLLQLSRDGKVEEHFRAFSLLFSLSEGDEPALLPSPQCVSVSAVMTYQWAWSSW